jgi:alpha-tubulin suppressor-like RCC1 family protein
MRLLSHVAKSLVGPMLGVSLGCTSSSEVGSFRGAPDPDDGGGGGGGQPSATLPLEPVQARLSLGLASTCAIDSAGAVVCWGTNQSGELGIGDEYTDASSTPEHVIGLGSGVRGVFGGTVAHCAVGHDGRVVCWGDSVFGSFNGMPVTHYPILEPFEAPGLASVVAMGIGTYFHCALNVEGGTKCYGINSVGQLGNGSLEDGLVPSDVIGLDACQTLTASQSGFFACAATLDGAAKCWGYNEHGQLGNGTKEYAVKAANVTGLDAGVTSLAAGRDHACAVVEGAVRCWGSNASGQLGPGPADDQTTPVDVSGLPPIVALAAGALHNCALTDTGAVHCWGGDPSAAVPALQIDGGVTELRAGGAHTCALLVDGRLRCWGNDDYGQLGPFSGEGALL